jgi:methyl-accepting chemotaxis protein
MHATRVFDGEQGMSQPRPTGVLGRLNSRWSFGARLALISGLFCAPVGLLLFLFLQASAVQIGFSSKELDGARYLDRVWPAVVKGEPAPSAEGRFGEGEALAAVRSAATPYARASAAADLITAVSDGSNLTLDPDLDSYYMMDAVAFRLPAVHKAARELEAAFASGDRDRIVLAAEHLSMAASQSSASLAAAMKNNAAGLTRAAMAQRAQAFIVAADQVSRESQAFLSGASIARPGFDALDAELSATWRASNRELSRLLVVRIDGFQHQLVLHLALTAAALAAAGLLSFLIARGLSARLGALLAAQGNRLIANLFALGSRAWGALTRPNQALAPHANPDLPYWDLAAALRPAGKLAGWGLAPATEARMRARHRWFVAQAFAALGG